MPRIYLYIIYLRSTNNSIVMKLSLRTCINNNNIRFGAVITFYELWLVLNSYYKYWQIILKFLIPFILLMESCLFKLCWKFPLLVNKILNATTRKNQGQRDQEVLLGILLHRVFQRNGLEIDFIRSRNTPQLFLDCSIKNVNIS